MIAHVETKSGRVLESSSREEEGFNTRYMELPETLRPHFRPVPSRYDFLDVDFEVRGREGERARGREGERARANKLERARAMTATISSTSTLRFCVHQALDALIELCSARCCPRKALVKNGWSPLIDHCRHFPHSAAGEFEAPLHGHMYTHRKTHARNPESLPSFLL